MKPSRNLLILFAAMGLLLGSSCSSPRTLNSIAIPDTPVLSADSRYAVVIEPYVSMRDQPGDKGITIAHSRRGDIFTVKGKRIVETADARVLWIDIGKGWVTESSVQLYSGEERAKTAAKSLK